MSSTPYLGTVMPFCGNFAPRGWVRCDGSLLPISEYEALFALIGTTYGGDGQNTFAVPDLRGRVPIHQGTGPGLSTRFIGEVAGSESMTLTAGQLPAHTHPLGTTAAATGQAPGASAPALAANSIYAASSSGSMAAGTIGASSGGGGSHNNLQPYNTILFCIAVEGIFPSQA